MKKKKEYYRSPAPAGGFININGQLVGFAYGIWRCKDADISGWINWEDGKGEYLMLKVPRTFPGRDIQPFFQHILTNEKVIKNYEEWAREQGRIAQEFEKIKSPEEYEAYKKTYRPATIIPETISKLAKSTANQRRSINHLKPHAKRAFPKAGYDWLKDEWGVHDTLPIRERLQFVSELYNGRYEKKRWPFLSDSQILRIVQSSDYSKALRHTKPAV